jgi:hypothetical protein
VSKQDVAIIADFRKNASGIFWRANLDAATRLISRDEFQFARKRMRHVGACLRGRSDAASVPDEAGREFDGVDVRFGL